MILTQKCLPRRTVLRGLGASLALPLLDGMIPALAALQSTAARPIRRFGVVYVPNGMAMGSWTPTAEGAGFELTPILQPLAPFRDQLTVVGGLSGPPSNGGVHASASTRFLTGISASRSEYDLQAGVSMDQLVAHQTGRHTQLASLELALDSREVSGSCDVGFACAYTNTIAWRGPQTPLPMENNPRVVFERLFGDSGSTSAAVRLARIKRQRSLLDSVSGAAAELDRQLGGRDRARLDEYLEAVRDVERRIQKAEEQSSEQLQVVDQPPGIPASYDEHAKLMFDLMLLAYQSDLTRVSTFMLARELSGRTYPEIGVADAHHPTSHHKDDRELIGKVAKINAYHTTLFAYFVERLKATPDGDGSLLDHIMIIYGAGMSDSNRHDPTNLPILLVGGAAGQLKGGRHVRYRDNPPMSNLLVTLIDKLGVPVDRIGNSTGKLELQALSGV
jgi:hypothetical protein